jgi:hypothetical protein
MKVNSIIIATGILILLSIQFYLFRFEKVGSMMYRNRYTNSVYIPIDGAFRSCATSESEKVKTLNNEIESLKSNRNEMLEQIKIRDEQIELLNEVSRRYFSEERKDIDTGTKRICYMIDCYYRQRGDGRIYLDNKFYDSERVLTGIFDCANTLKNLINKEAPE